MFPYSTLWLTPTSNYYSSHVRTFRALFAAAAKFRQYVRRSTNNHTSTYICGMHIRRAIVSATDRLRASERWKRVCVDDRVGTTTFTRLAIRIMTNRWYSIWFRLVFRLGIFYRTRANPAAIEYCDSSSTWCLAFRNNSRGCIRTKSVGGGM